MVRLSLLLQLLSLRSLLLAKVLHVLAMVLGGPASALRDAVGGVVDALFDDEPKMAWRELWMTPSTRWSAHGWLVWVYKHWK